MTFYTDMRATAERLIREKGQAVTYRHVVNGEYDPATGAAGTTVTNHPARAAVFGFKNSDIDGTLILKTDKRVLLACDSLAVEPSKDGRLQIGGVDHEIVSVEPIAPAGTAVVYIVQARK